jgi:lipopolysaccharide biosynthesis regulator YciM
MSRKDIKLIKSAEEAAEHIKQMENMVGKPAYDLGTPEVTQVKIRPDESMKPAVFKADPLTPGGYIAHPLTIEAMKKDIFLAGDDIDELVQPYECDNCKYQLDMQFWHFCPSCGSPFKL